MGKLRRGPGSSYPRRRLQLWRYVSLHRFSIAPSDLAVVVTEIIMKAIPKPPAVYAGYLLYTVDKLSVLAKHVEAFTLKNDDPRLSLILVSARISRTTIIILTCSDARHCSTLLDLDVYAA